METKNNFQSGIIQNDSDRLDGLSEKATPESISVPGKKANPSESEFNPGDVPREFTEKKSVQESPKADQSLKQASRADEIMRQLHTSYSPRPKVDQDKLDRLQKLGRLNQLGQSVNVLSDIWSLANGANVRQRRPDQVSPAIYEAYQRTLDKNKDLNDQADLRDWQLGRENLKMDLNNEYRKGELAYKNDVLRAKTDHDRLLAQQNWDKFQAELRQKQTDAEERKRHNKSMEGAN
jgi:hypothetical protein